MQLEDFNHAMFRAIYAIYLVFFGLLVLVNGIIMIPFGYLAVLVVRARLIYRECRDKHTRQFVMIKQAEKSTGSSMKKAVLIKFVSFLVTGMFELFVRSFTDTYTFM